MNSPVYIATRGSALALAQANAVLDQCRAAFPDRAFELRIIKTTGDKLQTASLANPGEALPKGLFTKELEVALLNGEADLAVHSLKDLPTELPPGLTLGAVGKRADVRDVFIYRDVAAASAGGGRGFAPKLALKDLPPGLTVATSSTRRQAQLLALRPDFKTVEIRGNVETRLRKLATQPEIDALVLAAAGLQRLNFGIGDDGRLTGAVVPEGLLATILPVELMLPCVGQGAIGLETRAGDERIAPVLAGLNHPETNACATAERAFLRAMGGGCQSPVGAHAEVAGGTLKISAVTFLGGSVRRGERSGSPVDAEQVGKDLAKDLGSPVKI